jgi:hypothetical protein
MTARSVGVLGLSIVFGLTGPGKASAQESPSALEAFVRLARDASARFASREDAIRAGYRRLGPDFPGMGEHWVHPQLVVRGVLDGAAPPVLSYIERDGVPVLVGLAYTLPLGPDEEPPEAPFGRAAWHDHSGAVDEETLLISHPSSMHGSGAGYRLSMVHVWTGLENADGILAQNNWALPFFRVGLEAPPGAGSEAARGASLARGGRAFYERLIARAADLSPDEEERIGLVLDDFSARAERAIASGGGAGPDPRDAGPAQAFAALWADFWVAVRAEVRPESWMALEMLAR